MEDNIQTIVIVLVSVFLLFIFPVYMAYEKKDDISYALAMRYTQDLVDEVRSKGYISKYMYDDYRAKLKVTGNSYDIKLTHEYNRYDPITNYYTVKGGKYTLVKTTTQEEKTRIINEGIEQGRLAKNATKEQQDKYIASVFGYDVTKVNLKSEDTYQIYKQTYTTSHIESILNSERKLLLNTSSANVKCSDSDTSTDGCEYAYIMNVGDNFNVTIKNTNTTLATVIYNMVTANTLDNNTRIYVNYGGAILSNKWYDSIDYSKMDHEKLTIDKLEVIEKFPAEQHYEEAKAETNVTNKFTKTYEGEYAIDFDVKPTGVTEIRQKGKLSVANYSGYNFAIGNNTALNESSMMSVSVGINGITLITNTSVNLKALTNKNVVLPTYQYQVKNSRIEQEEYTCIDEETGEEKTCIREKTVEYNETKTGQRKITDYSSLRVLYQSKGVLKVILIGKGVPNYTTYILVEDKNNLLKGLDKTINNPTSSVISGTKGEKASRGTDIQYKISITDTTISVSANQFVSEEMTILSYPVPISDYVNVRIEVKEKKNTEDVYTAILYLDGERVDESIDMNIIPKVNVVGMSIIGNEINYFDGSIKNVELYN